ncbi:hypothetical protein [Nocardioides donggukensis]|uniref:DUF559 domain-containing protein n=1 Tax=Nocardioides donggukensis TaxID=2774019 RepID=A0A927K1V3_9ACTN|nr:hypothetical protein [Nocardioides donggukensis]MBD8868354.1 hypothetical protein [Nocardioides donggukensis]
MEVTRALARLGTVATHARLVEATSRGQVRAALESGQIVRLTHGRYALPSVDLARAAAFRVNGVISHLSAALYWEWPVKHQPLEPVVTVPRGRKLTPARREGVDVRWGTLRPDELRRREVTSPLRSVIDCLRTLEPDAALAVGDSALRSGLVTRAEILAAAEELPVQFRGRVRRIGLAADARAENPFESAVRAHGLDVPGLSLVPQQYLPGVGYPDLLDEALGLVVECDSFGFHASRYALQRDCERYNACARLGLVVVRFAWEHAMRDGDYVRATLAAMARQRAGLRAARPGRGRRTP